MTTNRISHTDCTHEATKAARTACRKARMALRVEAAALIGIFNQGYAPSPDYWVWYAARHFADYRGADLEEAALAVLAYFRPSGNEARDARRKANGYTITTDIHTMRSITLRAAS